LPYFNILIFKFEFLKEEQIVPIVFFIHCLEVLDCSDKEPLRLNFFHYISKRFIFLDVISHRNKKLHCFKLKAPGSGFNPRIQMFPPDAKWGKGAFNSVWGLRTKYWTRCNWGLGQSSCLAGWLVLRFAQNDLNYNKPNILFLYHNLCRRLLLLILQVGTFESLE
jgi:hypothetical protein